MADFSFSRIFRSRGFEPKKKVIKILQFSFLQTFKKEEN